MLKLATKFAPKQDSFERAQEAGFQFAELWLNGNLLSNWQEVVELTKAFPLDYVLHFPNQDSLEEESLDELRQLVEAAKIELVVVHESHWQQYETCLRQRLPETTFAVENHFIESNQLTQWFRSHDAITLDVEHLWKFSLRDAKLGELLRQIENAFEESDGRIRHIHLPGYLPGREEHRPMYCSRDMVFAVLDLLDSYAFEGFIVSECSANHQNEQELRMDRLLFDLWQKHSRRLKDAEESLLGGPRLVF